MYSMSRQERHLFDINRESHIYSASHKESPELLKYGQPFRRQSSYSRFQLRHWRWMRRHIRTRPGALRRPQLNLLNRISPSCTASGLVNQWISGTGRPIFATNVRISPLVFHRPHRLTRFNNGQTVRSANISAETGSWPFLFDRSAACCKKKQKKKQKKIKIIIKLRKEKDLKTTPLRNGDLYRFIFASVEFSFIYFVIPILFVCWRFCPAAARAEIR